MGNREQIEAILAGLSVRDNKLYQVVQLLSQDIFNINQELFPIIDARIAALTDAPIPAVPTSFIYTLRPTSVHFEWQAGDTNARLYEIRRGSDWSTADFVVRTPSTQADINPILVGSYTYLLKSLNSENEESETAVSLIVIVPELGTPSITASVIDNNVLLKWTEPAHSFTIANYNIYRDATLIGTSLGTFEVVFETLSGQYTYKVTAVDIAGNESPQGTITVTVNQPPDFELLTSVTSIFDGTLFNVKLLENGHLLCTTDNAETFENHFLTRAWAGPQAQIDAGFPIYIQPNGGDGYYEEVFDFGTTLTNVIVNIDWNSVVISGSVAISGDFKGSVDGVVYDDSQFGVSAFYSSIRYLKLRINFVPGSTASLIEFYNLRVFVDVKREVDSGEIVADKDDIDGTLVLFNKVYKDVDSITLGCESFQPVKAIHDFTDVANPTSFRVMVFDESGNRVTRTVSWKSRGIV